jgi:hypothetical protein
MGSLSILPSKDEIRDFTKNKPIATTYCKVVKFVGPSKLNLILDVQAFFGHFAEGRTSM